MSLLRERRDGRHHSWTGTRGPAYALQPMDAIMSQTLPDMGRSWVRWDTAPVVPQRLASSPHSVALACAAVDPVGGHLKKSASAPLPAKDPSAHSKPGCKAQRLFDQRLVHDFELSEGEVPPWPQTQSQTWFSNTLPSRSSGLSDMARRENFKTDRYSQQIELRRAEAAQRAGASKSIGGDTQVVESGAMDNVKVLSPQAFLDDVKGVEGVIEDLSKSIRLEHLDGLSLQDRRRHAEQEAARRRKEEELRRARKAEQEARDPHRKISIKLENRRRFNAESIQKGVPMQMVEVANSIGKEQIAMVDTRALRGKCLGMTSGDRTVAQLLDTQRRRDQSTQLRDFARSMRSTRGYVELCEPPTPLASPM